MARIVLPATITVTHSELPGSPKESKRAGQSFSAVRELVCAWADRHTLVKELLGFTSDDGVNVTVHKAQLYPHKTDANIWAASVDPIEPFHPNTIQAGDAVTLANYSKYDADHVGAKLTVAYEVDPSLGGGGSNVTTGDEEVLITETVELDIDSYSIPHEGVYWGGTSRGAPVKGKSTVGLEIPAKIVSLMAWVVKLHKLPTLNDNLIEFAGHINSTSVLSRTLGFTFDAQTLLYLPQSFTRTWSVDGASEWECTLRFLYRESTWNAFWNRLSEKYEFLVDGANAVIDVYAETANFNNLFNR